MYCIEQHQVLEQAVNEGEYRQLVDIVTDATIFNDWPWLSTSSKYCSAAELMFITCRDSGSRLIAFMAIAITSEQLYRMTVRSARFLQYPFADRMGLLIHPHHPQALEELLEFIGKQLRKSCDVIILDELADSQGLVNRMQTWAGENDMPFFLQKTSRCPVADTHETTREELSARLTSNRRSNIKRHRKKLAKLNHHIIHKPVTPEEVETLLDELSSVESASWKGTTGQGILSTPEHAPFFREVSLQLARQQQLFVSLIYIDKQLASYRFGFVFRNTFLDYNFAYLPEYRAQSLGILLLDDLLGKAVSSNFAAVDGSRVGTNTNNLLTKWATDYVDHLRIYVFGASLRGKSLQFLVTTVKPWLKKTIARFRKSS